MKLGEGERPTGNQDWSAYDWRWAVRLANQGYRAEEIASILRKKPKGTKPGYSMKFMRLLEEKGPERANAYAQRTAEKAVDWVREHPPIRDRAAALEALVEVVELAESVDWIHYGGPGPRRALEGLFMVGEYLGSISFGLSLRDWAERVGMGMQDVRYQRDKLIRLGWLKQEPRPKWDRRTATYSLRPPFHSLIPRFHIHLHTGDKNVEGERLPPGSSSPQSVPHLQGRFLDRANRRCAISHDAFRPSALGDLGWYALSLLPRALEEVLASDLLDRLAIENGTFGDLDHDRATHEAERTEYHGKRREVATNV